MCNSHFSHYKQNQTQMYTIAYCRLTVLILIALLLVEPARALFGKKKPPVIHDDHPLCSDMGQDMNPEVHK